MKRFVMWCVTGVALALTVQAATAQNLVPVRRNVLGFSAAFMQPTGEFEQFVRWGGGLNMNFVAGLHREAIVGLRLEGSVLWYGHEHYDVWMGPRMPYSYFRVNTDNFIGAFGVGPQLTLGNGPIRPYGFGLVGVSYFATTSSLEGDYGGTWDSQLNYDDATLGLSAGGGLLMQLGGRGHPLFLDMGAQWTYNGRTTYLREGGMIEYPDGSLVMRPIRSEANHWVFRLGVAVGI